MKIYVRRVSFCIFLSAFIVISHAQIQHPNVIFILGDDIGYNVLSANGGTRFSTPNLDTMAKHGMRFTQCHATPLCSPSRHMLMTGRYNNSTYKDWGKLSYNESTFVNVFKNNGYKTALYGKWQLGGGDTAMRAFGFDNYCIYVPFTPAPIPLPSRYKSPTLYSNGENLPASSVLNKYSEDILTDSLLAFIEHNKTAPFFAYYSMVLAHKPFQPTPDDTAYANWNYPERSNPQFYPSMIKYMDKKIGEIIIKLKQLGLDTNTYVFFVTDNGSPVEITEVTLNGAFKGGKGSSKNIGTHVPLLIMGPGVSAGSINSQLVDFTDFLPTFTRLCNLVPDSASLTLDGKAFSNQILGQPDKAREWIFDHYNPFPGVSTLKRWVQNSSYKLYDSLGLFTFYNVSSDRDELFPLAASILTPQESQVKQIFKNVLDKYAASSPPVLNNTIVTNITDTSANLGANILPIGEFPSVQERGTIFSIFTINDNLSKGDLNAFNKLSEGGSAISSFIHPRNNFLPQTKYIANGYAINKFGIGYSPQISFRTLSKKIIAPPSNFVSQIFSQNEIQLNWNNAIFPDSFASARGYLIVYSTDYPSAITSPNGKDPSEMISKGKLAGNINAGLPRMPANSLITTGLSKDSTYHFLLVPYTWDGVNKDTYNYYTEGMLRTQAKPGPVTFIWIGGSSGMWSDKTKWSPNSVPLSSDTVQFISSNPATVSAIPNINLGKLVLKGKGSVTLTAAGVRTINVVTSDSALYISDSSLLIIGNNNAIMLNLPNGSKGIINGRLLFRQGSHRLIANDSAAVTFNKGSSFIAGDLSLKGFAGAPFGTTGNTNTILFTDSSAYVQNEGLSPFGLNSPASKITLQRRSNYFFMPGGNAAFGLSGRSYGNIIIGNGTQVSSSGSSDVAFNTLKVDSASSFSFTGNATNRVSISGDIISSGAGNIELTAGNILFANNGIQNIGAGTGTGQISLNRITVSAGTTLTLLRDLVSSVSTTISGTLACGSATLSGAGNFTLLAGAALQIGSPDGITSGVAKGNIQMSGRTFSSSANYIFNGSSDQKTGLFTTTPIANSVNKLTFATNGLLRLSGNLNILSSSGNSLSLSSGTVDLNGFILTIPATGKVSATGGNFSGTTGLLKFLGAGFVSGNVTLSNVEIAKSVDFGSGTVITSSLTINNGGIVVTNPPAYANGSTLIYNTGIFYKRGLEWSALSGKGYPNHVFIKGNTTVDVSANGFADRGIGGNLIVGSADSKGSLTMGASTAKLLIGNSIILGGNVAGNTLTLSTIAGSDLFIGGDWNRNSNGSFVPNGRKVIFNGNGIQVISGPGIEEVFPFISLSKTSGSVLLNNNLRVTQQVEFMAMNNALLNTAINALTISTTNQSAISQPGNGYIVGNLKRLIKTGINLNYLFPIGTNLGYTPVSLTFSSVSSSGNVSAASIDGEYPLLPSDIIKNKSINRYWKITNESLAFSTCQSRFTFLNTDRDPLVNTSSLIIAKNSNGWTYPKVSGRSANYTEISEDTSFGEYIIAQRACVVPTLSSVITNVRCFNTSTGAITINTSGGTDPFTFSWSGPNGFSSITKSIDNVKAGQYQLTVTSKLGCNAISTYNVLQPSQIVTNAQHLPITCNGATTNLVVNATGGTGIFQYTLSDGVNTTGPQANNSFTVGAGNYTVNIDDANNCNINTGSIAINEPTAITANATFDPIACNGATTNLVVNATGGTGIFQYTLSDGVNTVGPQASNSFTVGAGNYTVNIADANNCNISVQKNIIEPSMLHVSASYIPFNPGDTTTILTVVASGGVGNYSYFMYDSSISYGPQSNSTFIIKPGTYSIEVTDENLCKKKIAFVVDSTAFNPALRFITNEITINSKKDNKLEVVSYPNPTRSEFGLKIISRNYEENVKLLIYDQIGSKVFQSTFQVNQIFRFGGKFPPGIYFAQITKGSNHKILKLVKTK